MEEYLRNNLIPYKKVSDDVYSIDGSTYYLVDKEESIFSNDFRFKLTANGYDYWAFWFGGRLYRQVQGETHVSLDEIKYLGKANVSIPTPVFLGVHGGFELLNGSRPYSDWLKKAKFLGVKTLGLCERNTLRGAMKFQMACGKADINSILGAEFTVLNQSGDRYRVKVYIKNYMGWINAMDIGAIINVDNSGYIDEKEFISRLSGLVTVLSPKTLTYEQTLPYSKVDDLYWQLDSTEFTSDSKDRNYLLAVKGYLEGDIEPILIQDAYYLDREDSWAKKRLNAIGSSYDYSSDNEYFKSNQELYDEWVLLFNDIKNAQKIFKVAFGNLKKVSDICNFKIDTSSKHLPKYKMTNEEASTYKDNKDMFQQLIKKGIYKRFGKVDKKIKDRILMEMETIENAGVMDYFLILRDVVMWDKSQGRLQGLGRGSAAGSLVAYVLEITHTNPFYYDLSFFRFLNSGRASVAVEKDAYELIDEQGNTRTVFLDQDVVVERDGVQLSIKGEQIRKGDKFIV